VVDKQGMAWTAMIENPLLLPAPRETLTHGFSSPDPCRRRYPPKLVEGVICEPRPQVLLPAKRKSTSITVCDCSRSRRSARRLGWARAGSTGRLRSGEIPSVRLGRTIKVRRDDLEEYLERHRYPTGGQAGQKQ
jgi:excisionase family DNA binding protein